MPARIAPIDTGEFADVFATIPDNPEAETDDTFSSATLDGDGQQPSPMDFMTPLPSAPPVLGRGFSAKSLKLSSLASAAASSQTSHANGKDVAALVRSTSAGANSEGGEALAVTPGGTKPVGWGKVKDWWAKGKAARVVQSFRKERVVQFTNYKESTHHWTLKELLEECTTIMGRDPKRAIDEAKAKNASHATAPTPHLGGGAPKTPRSSNMSMRLLAAVAPAPLVTPRRRNRPTSAASSMSKPSRRSSVEMSSPMLAAEKKPSNRPGLSVNTSRPSMLVRKASVGTGLIGARQSIMPGGGGGGGGGYGGGAGPPTHAGGVGGGKTPRGLPKGVRQSVFGSNLPVKTPRTAGGMSGGMHRSSARKRTSIFTSSPFGAAHPWNSSRYEPIPSPVFVKQDLHIRDLRNVSPLSNSTIRPTIVVRKSVLILKLEHVRAVILHDTVFLMGEFEGPHALSEERLAYFRTKFGDGVHEKPTGPFEYHVLKVLLDSVHDKLEADFQSVKKDTADLRKSRTRKNEMNPAMLDKLRFILVHLSELFARGEDVCNSLAAVLDDNEDLAMMCLSRHATQDEIELVVETRWQAINNVNHEVVQLSDELSEEQVNFQLKLEHFSNRFVWSSFTFRIVNLVFTFGAMWTAILGMNISVGFDGDGWDPEEEKTFLWRKADSVFASTTIGLCAGCFCLCLLTLWCVSRAYVG